MPDIKYVCLSDMHFGAQNSLLTKLAPDGLKPNFLEPSPVLIALVENLRSACFSRHGRSAAMKLLNRKP